MAGEKDKIKKIQKSIEDILGAKSGIAKKRPSIKDKKRELFNTILNNLSHVNSRSLGIKHDYKIDFIEYDDPFFNIIEALIELHFNKNQKSLIEWYLYDKFLPTGEMLILNDADTGKEIPTETPNDIWELIQQYEEKDNK
tara:strand:+ start:1838 stop:2257 length:420 start_codon:yes stop_codon:yes gene_type:complete